ncbi:SYLF and SH3 domain-containing protein Ecym_2747 [Eremothecium cymbalariae DBVPG|uniref:SH3 domain-containing protein n=1 Tax=Eremothecium cymbalariae (strain CBS 270.75 / DBVPG 7215 / KCTC 17166 / NRRL Y-17582) TaxID=931890 RepID=G8JPY3_ERECY|nr:Hypothetical protein Ecym_2747 [Eremothecium cymbalariae DBVPG\
MGINNPVPRSLKNETKKAAKVLASFVKPNQVLGTDEVIPPHILKNAKGLAIITVLKAGFLFSGRAGSGVIVARLPDGGWSPPSAIAMAGAGAGGMVGVELTDFVFILNTADAVKSFSQAGSITLGGNISVAAGPLGRNAEAAATASLSGVAAIFSYSKTKGLFAGVSVEGSIIIERRDANRKFYGASCTTKAILSGLVNAPPSVDPLFRVLRARAFNPRKPDGASVDGTDSYTEDYYGDVPSNFESNDQESSSADRRQRGLRSTSNYHSGSRDNYREYDDYGLPTNRNASGRNNSPGYDGYLDDDDSSDYFTRGTTSTRIKNNSGSRQKASSRGVDDEYSADISALSGRFQNSSKPNDSIAPSRPTSEKPDFGLLNTGSKGSHSASIRDRPSSGTPKAVALYTFKGEQDGDLPFRTGDVIAILKKSNSQDDWWTGRVNGQEGIFPANYVELV